MPAFKCSGCQCLFASRSLLRIHQRETGCFRSVVESALAAFIRTREFSASPALGEGDRTSRPVVDRHEGTTEPIAEQEDIPDFEGVSPVASVTSNNPMEIEEVDEVVNDDVEEEPAVTEIGRAHV